MKKNWIFWCVSLWLCGSALADIREVTTMAEALKDVKPGTLVIFDIDNTLLEPTHMLGADTWIEDRIKEKGLKQGLFEWKKIQRVATLRPVEPSIPGLVKDLQEPKREVKTLGLTARPVDLMESSLLQLTSNGIDLGAASFGKALIQLETSDDDVNWEARYSKGVIFAGNHPKGGILTKFLKHVEWKPTKIIFVDDKLKNVKSIEESLDKQTIPHTSFRYGAADKKVKEYDKAIADVQEKHFRILTDEEAKRELKK